MKNLLLRVILYKKFKHYALLISMIMFFASLTQNCYSSFLVQCHSGIGLLIAGWTGIYLGGPMLTWLANPFLFIAWQTLKQCNFASLIFSLLAFFTSLSFLLFSSIFDIDEGTSAITHYKAGYWLWLSSCLVMMMANSGIFCKKQILKYELQS